MSKQFFKYSVLFFLLIVVFSSCKTKQMQVEEPKKDLDAEALFSKLKENELKYENIAIRFDAEVIMDKQKNSVKGNLRIKKDSIIWISITPLAGIEAARIVFTQDSVKMINKLNNTYFLGNYSFVNNMFNVSLNYEMIQSLFTANDFSFYENGVFKVAHDSKYYKLSTPGRHKLKKYLSQNSESNVVIIQDIWLDPTSFKIVRQKWKEIKRENTKLEFEYSNFVQLEDGQMFPHRLNCQISGERSITFNLNSNRVQLERAFDFPFIIPDKYKPFQF